MVLEKVSETQVGIEPMTSQLHVRSSDYVIGAHNG